MSTIRNLIKKIFVGLLSITSIALISGCSSKSNTSIELNRQIDEYIYNCKLDGTLEELNAIWIENDVSRQNIDRTTSGKTTITYASTSMVGAPMCYLSNDGPTGYTIDLMYRFAREYNYNLEIVDCNSLTSLLATISAGKADIGGSGLAITEERMEAVTFTDSYFDSYVVLVTSKDNKLLYPSFDDLNGKKFGYVIGSTGKTCLEQYIQNAQITVYSSYADAIAAFNKGDIIGFAADDVVAYTILRENPTYEIYGRIQSDPVPFAFLTKKIGPSAIGEVDDLKIGCYYEYTYNDDIITFVNDHLIYRNELKDAYELLKSGETNFLLVPDFLYKDALKFDKQFYPLPISYGRSDYAIGFNPGNTQLRDKFNEYLAAIKESGQLNEFLLKWFNSDEKTEINHSMGTFHGEETLIFGVYENFSPLAYRDKNGNFAGIEVELFNAFCLQYGYQIEYVSLQLEDKDVFRCDAVATCAPITYQQKIGSKLLTSDVYYSSHYRAFSKPGSVSKFNLFTTIATSFRKTFIIDNRYQQFLDGVLNTILITLMSIVLGILIGYLLYTYVIKDHKIAEKVYKVINKILTGMPVVVLLMIFYYVFFGKSQISGFWVSVIVFTLLFTCTTISLLNLGVSSVDKGQEEGALALGYTRNKAFHKVILPQALKLVSSNFASEAVSHIKATAIVGYIAVNDLTRISDIVRSNTFEAFFPLFATAIIYFLLGFLLSVAVKALISIFDKRSRRKKIDSTVKGEIKNAWNKTFKKRIS